MNSVDIVVRSKSYRDVWKKLNDIQSRQQLITNDLYKAYDGTMGYDYVALSRFILRSLMEER